MTEWKKERDEAVMKKLNRQETENDRFNGGH